MALDMALHAAVGLCADRLISLGAVLVMARTNLKAFPVTLTLTLTLTLALPGGHLGGATAAHLPCVH